MRLELLVRRVEEYESWQRLLAKAEAVLIGARLHAKLSESRDIERKLPDLHTRTTNLTGTIERIGREMVALESVFRELEIGVEAARTKFEALDQERDQLISARAIAKNNFDRAQSQIRELESLPERDVHSIESQLEGARQQLLRIEQEIDSTKTRLHEVTNQVASLN